VLELISEFTTVGHVNLPREPFVCPQGGQELAGWHPAKLGGGEDHGRDGLRLFEQGWTHAEEAISVAKADDRSSTVSAIMQELDHALAHEIDAFTLEALP